MNGLHILRKIQAVQALLNCRLQIIYEGGEAILIDFGPVIRQGGVFAPLADPGFFGQVSVDPRGRAVRWPGDLEFCADALWLQAHAAEVA
jgi:hypothetical protein